MVAEANANAVAEGFGAPFSQRSLFTLAPGEVSADLIVCCEVLEHVPDPGARSPCSPPRTPATGS